MIGHVFVKSTVEGQKVQKEHSSSTDRQFIDAAGEWVPHNPFYAIRLLHKDLVEAEPPAELAKPEPIQDTPLAEPPLTIIKKRNR